MGKSDVDVTSVYYHTLSLALLDIFAPARLGVKDQSRFFFLPL